MTIRGIIIVVSVLACFVAANDPFATLEFGGGLDSSRYYPKENRIKPCNVDKLELLYSRQIGYLQAGVITAYKNITYFHDFVGNIYALNIETNTLVWQVALSSQTGRTTVTRSALALAPEEGILVFGDYNRGYIYGANMTNGQIIWSSNLESHVNARVTQSPIIYQGKVFIGMSSGESGALNCTTQESCYFKGKFSCVDLLTGTILWQFQTVPTVNSSLPGDQYAGGAIWGTSPSIDPDMNAVFFGTGNNYRVPDSVYNCTAEGSLDCDIPENRANSIIALDIDTGALIWSRKFANTTWGYDAYTTACGLDGNPSHYLPNSCPPFAGLDADFAHTMLVDVRRQGKKTPAIVLGQKSGMAYCLRRSDGELIWVNKIGPDGMAGGIHFGHGTDGRRAFFSNVNSGPAGNVSTDGRGLNWTLVDGTVTNGGFWTALDVSTGAILWQTAEPNRARTYGPLTVFKGLLFSGSFSTVNSNLFALDSSTGEILWTDFAPGSRFATPTPYKGKLIVGNGYAGQSFYGGDNHVYVYGLPDSAPSCDSLLPIDADICECDD